MGPIVKHPLTTRDAPVVMATPQSLLYTAYITYIFTLSVHLIQRGRSCVASAGSTGTTVATGDESSHHDGTVPQVENTAHLRNGHPETLV